MKFNFKKAISFILCLCLISSFCLTNISRASGLNEASNSNIEVVCDNDEICTVLASYKDDEVYATLNKITNEITMKVVEKAKAGILGIPSGKSKITDLSVKADLSNINEISAIITDTKTGRTYKIGSDSGKVTAQYVIVPIVTVIGKAALAALAAVAVARVFENTTFYDFTNAINKLKQSKKYDYYAAVIVLKEDVYLAGGLTFDDARKRMKAGKDVCARTKVKAETLCTDVGGGYPPIHHYAHEGQGKYYNHYHPSSSSPYSARHCFYP